MRYITPSSPHLLVACPHPPRQFSLDAYVDLFNTSIESSRTGEEDGVGERCDVINKYHTRSVYEYTCRGLFERHKLLFSLQVPVFPPPHLCLRLFGGQRCCRSTLPPATRLACAHLVASGVAPSPTPLAITDIVVEMDDCSYVWWEIHTPNRRDVSV